MVVVAVSFAACAFMGLAFSLYIVAGRKNQAAHRNMRDLCILPFFGRLPEIWQRREWPDASVRSWDSRQNRPLQARRPEAIHTISLADSSQLLVECEERSSIAPRNNEIEHVVDRVVILNGRMDRF